MPLQLCRCGDATALMSMQLCHCTYATALMLLWLCCGAVAALLLDGLLDVLKEHQADWVHFGVLDIRTVG